MCINNRKEHNSKGFYTANLHICSARAVAAALLAADSTKRKSAHHFRAFLFILHSAKLVSPFLAWRHHHRMDLPRRTHLLRLPMQTNASGISAMAPT